jgi:DNA-binding PadR family transcriptional regulator
MPEARTATGYLRANLLLLVGEEPSYGYGLLERLAYLGVDGVDSGGLYRCLRSMEDDGLVRSSWEAGERAGPRRVYRLTGEGEEQLRACAQAATENNRLLRRYISRYRKIGFTPEATHRRSG